MELINPTYTIHPHARELLFQHKRVVSRVYRDVLGLHEIDHIAITSLNKNYQLSFLSHTPALEYNLIQTGLWMHDASYHPSFLSQHKAQAWPSLYAPMHRKPLINLKQIKTNIRAGLSIPDARQTRLLMFSFGTCSKHPDAASRLLDKAPELLQIGYYCFHQLSYLFLSSKPHPEPPKLRVITSHLSHYQGSTS